MARYMRPWLEDYLTRVKDEHDISLRAVAEESQPRLLRVSKVCENTGVEEAASALTFCSDKNFGLHVLFTPRALLALAIDPEDDPSANRFPCPLSSIVVVKSFRPLLVYIPSDDPPNASVHRLALKIDDAEMFSVCNSIQPEHDAIRSVKDSAELSDWLGLLAQHSRICEVPLPQYPTEPASGPPYPHSHRVSSATPPTTPRTVDNDNSLDFESTSFYTPSELGISFISPAMSIRSPQDFLLPPYPRINARLSRADVEPPVQTTPSDDSQSEASMHSWRSRTPFPSEDFQMSTGSLGYVCDDPCTPLDSSFDTTLALSSPTSSLSDMYPRLAQHSPSASEYPAGSDASSDDRSEWLANTLRELTQSPSHSSQCGSCPSTPTPSVTVRAATQWAGPVTHVAQPSTDQSTCDSVGSHTYPARDASSYSPSAWLASSMRELTQSPSHSSDCSSCPSTPTPYNNARGALPAARPVDRLPFPSTCHPYSSLRASASTLHTSALQVRVQARHTESTRGRYSRSRSSSSPSSLSPRLSKTSDGSACQDHQPYVVPRPAQSSLSPRARERRRDVQPARTGPHELSAPHPTASPGSLRRGRMQTSSLVDSSSSQLHPSSSANPSGSVAPRSPIISWVVDDPQGLCPTREEFARQLALIRECSDLIQRRRREGHPIGEELTREERRRYLMINRRSGLPGAE
ncbi:hypothetical protein PENSPDRAFT_656154 [Peniophora sp. CONT]|nr:hypothetical protein PENSPDRAFT_656154 [Peniophora sp. CONT]